MKKYTRGNWLQAPRPKCQEPQQLTNNNKLLIVYYKENEKTSNQYNSNTQAKGNKLKGSYKQMQQHVQLI